MQIFYSNNFMPAIGSDGFQASEGTVAIKAQDQNGDGKACSTSSDSKGGADVGGSSSAGPGLAGEGGGGAGAASTTGGAGGSTTGSAGSDEAIAGSSNVAGGSTVSAGSGAGSAGSSGVAGSAPGGSAGAASGVTACIGNATYKITLNVSWADAAVTGRHYTTIIGGAHSAKASLWKLGATATDGVKSMAEAGGTAMLEAEVNAAVGAGTAKSVIKFGGGNAPGTSSTTVELDPKFSQLSFGSMIAPSPDWFVGVSSLDLCEAGSWVPTKTLEAVVYDAGTKDGADFDYGFPETEPRAPIVYSVKFPGKMPAGSLKFEKQ